MNISIEVSKGEVMSLVAQETAYKGAKRVEDETAFDRISTIDEDEKHLTTFFEECRVELVETFGKNITAEGMAGDKYTLGMKVADTFNLALMPGLALGLRNFFVHGILGRWYELIGDESAKSEYGKSVAYLDMMKKKSFVTGAFTRKISVM